MERIDFIPKNEKGLFYIFSRFHEKFGFEKIISFQQWPDLIAKRKGETVRVELEFKLSDFLRHHYRITQPVVIGCWKRVNGGWILQVGNDIVDEMPDPKHIIWLNKNDNALYLKSLGDKKVDVVICWIKDIELSKFIDDKVEVIELSRLINTERLAMELADKVE
ncbi:hypothetical protein DRO54_05205 [Candidatus Bathyarchaeota archaeon]|nr:MAG: hypothetical protein DRO54_05205 [Candidatus Bathyarchaeota archaeon]